MPQRAVDRRKIMTVTLLPAGIVTLRKKIKNKLDRD